MRFSKTLTIMAALLLTISLAAAAGDARMMRYPDIHKGKTVFTYAGDLWVAGTGGEYARQLTSSKGLERFAKFSPNGNWIAYTGQYNGYNQVYVIPSTGGTPKQLTFYPAFRSHQVMDWTPDGKHIVFAASYFDTNRKTRLYKVSYEGGWYIPFPLVETAAMSFSPDGKKIAMNRTSREFRTWKRYKGGRQQDIWIFDFKTEKLEKVTTWEGTDRHPMWHGDKIYYISDETKKLNLYSYDVKSRENKRVTDYKEWDVRWPGFGPEAIVFEKGGKLFTMSFNGEKVSELKVKIAYDKSQLRPTYINTARLLNSYSLPNGAKRFTVAARGEIFTVPNKKGNIRNITNSPGINENSIDWSPDGKWIGFVAGNSGSDEIYIMDQYGKNKQQITKETNALMFGFVWSPDSKKMAYSDTEGNLSIIDVESKEVTLIEKSKYGPFFGFSWSHDSNWVAYQKIEKNTFSSIFLYNPETAKIFRVTGEFTNDFSPVFDPKGKYLFFVSSRDYNPTLSNSELNWIFTKMNRVYMVTLQGQTPSPFAPESDEVEAKADGKKPPKKKGSEPKKLIIETKGLQDRIVALPISPADIGGLMAGNGVLYYAKNIKPFSIDLFRGGATGNNLFAYDFKSKKESMILPGIAGYTLSPDAKHMLWATRSHYGISPAGPRPIKPQMGKPMAGLKLEALKVPLKEWEQMLKEAWRLEKYNFYVRNMHGVDWDAMLKKYSSLLPYASHRDDLSYILGEMIGELNTSHTYVAGGDMPRVRPVQTGLLSCDFEPDKNGFFRIKKIFRGENWNARARSPLTEAGIKAAEGNYILAINGKDLKLPTTPYELLEKTVGKIVTLKLNTKPVEKGSWTVKVKPVRSEYLPRYFDWVENNRRKVEKATNGRVGYLHIPDCMIDGLNQFTRGWYPQLKKEGIIIDARYNGGGFVSPMILERLRRKVVSLSASRYFGNATYPGAGFAGQLVMLTNKYAGSDGDNLPYYFQQYEMGPVIGTRSWGGIVGIYGFTPLMDGGFVSIPTATRITLDGKWVPTENHGADPDIVIDNLPQDEYNGKDAQLDKAIEVVMENIKKKPVKLPGKPKGPVKTK